LGVRVNRLGDDGVRRAALDDLAAIDDVQLTTVADISGGRHVMRDEHQRDAQVLTQIPEELQDAEAHRHVDHRDGLVGDQNLRVDGQRARDYDSLSLATRECMRIFRQHRVGIEPDKRKQFLSPALGPCAGFAGFARTHPQRVAEDLRDRAGRVQCRIRILVDHLDLAEQRRPLAAGDARDIDAVDDELAAVIGFESGEDLAERRLAAAGFADERDRTAFRQPEVDAAEGLNVDRSEQRAGVIGPLESPCLDHCAAPVGVSVSPARSA